VRFVVLGVVSHERVFFFFCVLSVYFAFFCFCALFVCGLFVTLLPTCHLRIFYTIGFDSVLFFVACLRLCVVVFFCRLFSVLNIFCALFLSFMLGRFVGLECGMVSVSAYLRFFGLFACWSFFFFVFWAHSTALFPTGYSCSLLRISGRFFCVDHYVLSPSKRSVLCLSLIVIPVACCGVEFLGFLSLFCLLMSGALCFSSFFFIIDSPLFVFCFVLC